MGTLGESWNHPAHFCLYDADRDCGAIVMRRFNRSTGDDQRFHLLKTIDGIGQVLDRLKMPTLRASFHGYRRGLLYLWEPNPLEYDAIQSKLEST